MANILICDDHDLVRDTIAAYLSQVEGFNVSVASDLRLARQQLAGEISFDLVILDYKMPGMSGLKGLAEIAKDYPFSKLALMSGVATPDVAKDAMKIGADGYFPKSLSATTLVNAVQFVLSGEKYFPMELALAKEEAALSGDFENLTAREVETLRGLCSGKSNKEIARDLDLQEVTIKLHVKNILLKLGVGNRTQAAVYAKDNGFE